MDENTYQMMSVDEMRAEARRLATASDSLHRFGHSGVVEPGLPAVCRELAIGRYWGNDDAYCSLLHIIVYATRLLLDRRG